MRVSQLMDRVRARIAVMVIVVLSFGFAPGDSAAADQTLEYGVKAAFLSKFGLFTEWPEGTFDSASRPFNLCIVGDDPFGPSLDKITGEQVIKGLKINVQRVKTVAADSGCQILYIGISDSARIGQILESLRGRSVLTVTDGRLAGSPTGVINFIIKDDRVRFDIDDDMAAQNGLYISSTLLGLAVNVKRRQSREVR